MKCDAVTEFIELNKNNPKYLHLNEKEFRKILESPFKLVREIMENDITFSEVRLKYFGVFKPHIRNLYGQIHRLNGMLKTKKITQKRYSEVVEAINKKINELKQKQNGTDTLEETD